MAVKPSLSVETDPEMVKLSFYPEPPLEFFSNLNQISKVSIPSLRSSFTYRFIYTVGTSNEATIDFNFGAEFSNKPIMFLEFTLTPEILMDDSFYLEKTLVNVTLPDYFIMSDATRNSLKSAGQSTQRGSQLARVMMILQNVMNVGSSVAVKSLILMELIRFLRFIAIE
jgi:hypothetical protein